MVRGANAVCPAKLVLRGRIWLFHRLGGRRNSRWTEHDPTDMPAVQQAGYYNNLYVMTKLFISWTAADVGIDRMMTRTRRSC